MPQIDIPQDLFQQIQQALPPSETTDQFIQEAVRKQLAWQERRAEFFRLSDITRQAMAAQVLTEVELLEDFYNERRKTCE